MSDSITMYIKLIQVYILLQNPSFSSLVMDHCYYHISLFMSFINILVDTKIYFPEIELLYFKRNEDILTGFELK